MLLATKTLQPQWFRTGFQSLAPTARRNIDNLFKVVLILTGVLNSIAGQPNGSEWHAERGMRWTSLELPQQGKTGFTLLPPEQTGLQFTNTLDEWSSAANRVLENGSGVAAGDFDNDGRPDIFLCSLQGRSALYRNLGSWRFEEVTLQAGLNLTNYVCRGAVFADLNGDGWLDLLISTLGHGVLCYLNDGAGRFMDATARAGTETQYGSTTLALADIDGNGTLDLYVTNYRSEDIRDRSRVEVQFINGRMVLPPWYKDRLILTQEGLREFGEPDLLYRNDGQGHFQPVAWTDGTFLDENGKPLVKPPLDWGLTATFRDLNGDGYPDLYVCNDYWTPDRIWINNGHGHFQPIAAWAIRHTSENSMGMDFADIDRDGHPDFLVLDMVSRDPWLRKRQVLAQTKMPNAVGEIDNRPQIMRNTLFHNRGDGTFEEIADYCGLPASDWSWQPIFIDVDLDGYEDLIIPAGHRRDVQDLDATLRIKALQHPWPKDLEAKARQEAFTREMMQHARLYPELLMPIVAFHNLGNLKFAETTEVWGTAARGVHQGIAFADFDGDGDLDFVVNNLNGVCGAYRNDTIAPRVAVRLKGLSPNTQGIGALVRLLGGAVPMQSQEVVCGGRYLSGFDPLLVFAAGTARGAMSLEVRWRSGEECRVPGVRPNRLYEIEERQEPKAGSQESGGITIGPGIRLRLQESRVDRKVQSANLKSSLSPPWFKDVSDVLNHKHVENDFNDFVRQPLLNKRLSQLGPGVCWYDLDGDGHEDLVIGSGSGGCPGVYLGNGRGGFKRINDAPVATAVSRDQTAVVALRNSNGQPLILAGSANYEDGLVTSASVRQYNLVVNRVDDSLPGLISSTGPLALADLAGDGSLALFVGGRVIPGCYPEPASSRIYRQKGGAWQLDEANSRLLEKVGLVSGAVWSDLDGDGFPELILACEWGPIRIYKTVAGRLHEVTAEWGMSPYTGWWSGVTTGDLDNDGKLDIIASNWGLNSPYQASTEHPARLYYGDLNGLGFVDLIETEYDPIHQIIAPRNRLDVMAAGLPFLREQYATYKAFSEAAIDEVLGDRRAKATMIEVRTLASTVFFNRGNHFEAVELPPEAQFAPAFSVNVADFDGDGCEDVFLSQNFFDFPWEMHRLDAGRGLWLKGDGTGRLSPVAGQDTGILVYGEQRGAALCDFDEDGRIDLVITQNGAATKLYRNIGAKPGLRVRLIGPPGNPTGVGAALRLKYGDRFGPAREIHAGSGYWSQDGAVQVMSWLRPLAAESERQSSTGVTHTNSPGSITPLPGQTEPNTVHLQVRWPGGKEVLAEVPANAKEISIDREGRVR